MLKNKNILITGGTGFLGSNLIKALIGFDCNIFLLKRSFSNTFRIDDVLNRVVFFDLDKNNLHDIFQDKKIDIILHCATDYGRKDVDPINVIEANLLLPIKLLHLGTKFGVKMFVNTDTVLDKKINHYSLSKKQFYDWLFDYKEKISCVNIALDHFYGVNDDKTKFISYIVDSLKKNVEKIDLTPGGQKRGFLYVDDVVDGFIRIINNAIGKNNDFYNFNIGNKDMVSVRGLVEKIKEVSKNRTTILNFGALPYRDNEVMEYELDLTAIYSLGWSPKYSLEDGLRKII